MRFTFVPKSTFFMVLTFAMIFLVLGAFRLLLLTIVGLGVWTFVLRKKIVFENDDQFTTRGSVFSPISGRVTLVEETTTNKVITIKTTLLDNFGLYLPSTSEVKNLNYEKTSHVFWFDKTSVLDLGHGVVLELHDKNRQIFTLQFIKYYLGNLPELVILPGDRGQRHANFGYFLFGGLTKVFLPQTFNIEVKAGDKVISTESIIARFSDKE